MTHSSDPQARAVPEPLTVTQFFKGTDYRRQRDELMADMRAGSLLMDLASGITDENRETKHAQWKAEREARERAEVILHERLRIAVDDTRTWHLIELHHDNGGGGCDGCGYDPYEWPCPTYRLAVREWLGEDL